VENSDLFGATVGGMGLTGTIVKARFRLQPVETGWIRQRTIVANDLDQVFTMLAAHNHATYSVAWIDCLARKTNLGRSLIYLGEHASVHDLEKYGLHNPVYPSAKSARWSVPFDFTPFVLNRRSIAVFNQIYFWRNAQFGRGEEFLIPWDQFFFRLDGIENWNRI